MHGVPLALIQSVNPIYIWKAHLGQLRNMKWQKLQPFLAVILSPLMRAAKYFVQFLN